MTENDAWPIPQGVPGISFTCDQVHDPELDTSAVRQWLTEAVHREEHTLGTVSIVFVDDPTLHQMNLEHLDHDTLTDILTFPFRDDRVDGEIYISLDRVRDNAQTFRVPFHSELHRVLIHGILHLMGYTDTTPEEKARMTEQENFHLAYGPAIPSS